ncbi:hypothetical protein KBC79_01490 [Candidatus Woesebacteria bacterium]|nr:hypothetical protein [Candidatus Woesebacteria bacterium]
MPIDEPGYISLRQYDYIKSLMQKVGRAYTNQDLEDMSGHEANNIIKDLLRMIKLGAGNAGK